MGNLLTAEVDADKKKKKMNSLPPCSQSKLGATQQK